MHWRCNFSVLAMELCLFCVKPLMCSAMNYVNHSFREWLVTWSAPSHFLLNQCWLIVDQTFRNNLQFESKFTYFLSRKCIWKCCPLYGIYFVKHQCVGCWNCMIREQEWFNQIIGGWIGWCEIICLINIIWVHWLHNCVTALKGLYHTIDQICCGSGKCGCCHGNSVTVSVTVSVWGCGEHIKFGTWLNACKFNRSRLVYYSHMCQVLSSSFYGLSFRHQPLQSWWWHASHCPSRCLSSLPHLSGTAQ